jgi:2-polyprenyl-3-methyl-5-hydroxy-6-metoxy-1,4-benzoquinol methylase
VDPEILDGLAPDDPEAVKSRRDLLRINRLMGNSVWMSQALEWAGENTGGPIWELGAGDGVMLDPLVDAGWEVTGVDLAERPGDLPEGIGWRQGDVFEVLGDGVEGVVAANLFLHHLSDEELEKLGGLVSKCQVLCFSEPWRSRWALLEGALLWPFVSRVTRHDMMVSIRAGFRTGELPELLGLGDEWTIQEQCTKLGAYRLLAWKE